ncbi:hypothetical protein J2809_001486 [Arthrobacter pascens]|nr:hypothetical protein [Arthrobacter pascens]
MNASIEAASPGSTVVRRLLDRIMWLPLLGEPGLPRAGICPGYLPTRSRGSPNPYCRFSGGRAIWSLRTLPLPTM